MCARSTIIYVRKTRTAPLPYRKTQRKQKFVNIACLILTIVDTYLSLDFDLPFDLGFDEDEREPLYPGSALEVEGGDAVESVVGELNVNSERSVCGGGDGKENDVSGAEAIRVWE